MASEVMQERMSRVRLDLGVREHFSEEAAPKKGKEPTCEGQGEGPAAVGSRLCHSNRGRPVWLGQRAWEACEVLLEDRPTVGGYADACMQFPSTPVWKLHEVADHLPSMAQSATLTAGMKIFL